MLRYRYGKVEFHQGIDDSGLPHPDHHGQQVVPPAPNQTSKGSPQTTTAKNTGVSEAEQARDYTWQQWEDPSQPGAAYAMRMEGGTTLAGFGTQEGAEAYRSYYTQKQPGGAQPLFFKGYDPSAWEIIGTGEEVSPYLEYRTEDKPRVVSAPELLTRDIASYRSGGWKDEDPRNPAWGTYDDPASVRLHGMALDTELAEKYGTGAVYAGREIEIGTRVDLGDGKIGELTPIGWRFEEDIVGGQNLSIIDIQSREEGKQPVISLRELQRQVTESGEAAVSSIAPDAPTATTESILGPQPDVTFYEKFINDYRDTVLDADMYQADDATKAELERIANIRFPHQQHYEEVLNDQGQLVLLFTADLEKNPELRIFEMSMKDFTQAQEMVSLKNQARQKLRQMGMIESEAAMTEAQRAQIYGGGVGEPQTLAQQQMAQQREGLYGGAEGEPQTIAQQQMAQGQTQFTAAQQQGQTQFEASQAQTASQFSQQQQLGYYQTEVGMMESKAGRDLQREIATNQLDLQTTQTEWTQSMDTYTRLRDSMKGGQYIDPISGETISVAGALSDLQETQTKKNELTATMIETQYDLENVNIAERFAAEAELGIDVLSLIQTRADAEGAMQKGLITERGTEERKGILLSKQWDWSIQELQNSGAMARLTEQIEAEAIAAGIRMTHEEAAQQAELDMRELLAQNSINAAKANLSTQGQQAIAQIELSASKSLEQQAAMNVARATLAGNQITHEQAMNDARIAAQEAAVVTGGLQERLTLREQQAIAGEIRQEYAITATSEAVNIARQSTTSYMTQLGTAMTSAAASEDGDTTGIAQALQMELPPTPSGIVWDTATATFAQRAGFEGREMDAETQQWIAASSPAFRARDRAEQVVRESNRLRQEMTMRVNERRMADEDFRQAMLTGEIDSAEEAVARQRIAETQQIEKETQMQNLTMLLNLLANPMQLAFAKKYGLLGQIEASLGFNVSNVTTGAAISGIPNVNEWQTMDNEQKQFSIAEYIEQGGTVDEFMQLVAGNSPAQMQQLQYATF